VKVVIVYDSVSATRLTAKVAEVIANALRDQGLEVTSVPVGDAKQVNIEEYDSLVVGSPTMAWALTKATKEFLAGLKGRQFTGKRAASFDTQIKSVISGNANKAMEAKLKELGYTIARPYLQAYVKGKKDAYQMVDGEMEKAAAWAKELGEALKKTP
jgi:flavodoxin